MTQQNDIFSLFGLVDEHEEVRKKEEEKKKADAAEVLRKKLEASKEKAAAEKTTTPATSTPKEDSFLLNEDTIIKYYGESIPVTEYFSVEELAEGLLIKKKDSDPERKPLDAEMLRKKMEVQFPELVKNHTDIVYIKAKNMVIPVMKAKKKGNYQTETLSLDSVSPFYSKIPSSILFEFIALAKLFGEQQLEIHADIYFDYAEKRYFIDIPDQTVHRYWTLVTEDASSIVERVNDAIKVIEIHSHHSMRAIPSSQDNESERVPGRLYAIVGMTHKFLPDLYCRKFVSEDIGFITVPPGALFDELFHSIPSLFDPKKIEVNV